MVLPSKESNGTRRTASWAGAGIDHRTGVERLSNRRGKRLPEPPDGLMILSGCDRVQVLNSTAKFDITTLTISERLELMEALWDSLIESPDALPLGDAQRAVLDQRLVAYEKEPTEGSTWHEVRARIQGA